MAGIDQKVVGGILGAVKEHLSTGLHTGIGKNVISMEQPSIEPNVPGSTLPYPKEVIDTVHKAILRDAGMSCLELAGVGGDRGGSIVNHFTGNVQGAKGPASVADLQKIADKIKQLGPEDVARITALAQAEKSGFSKGGVKDGDHSCSSIPVAALEKPGVQRG